MCERKLHHDANLDNGDSPRDYRGRNLVFVRTTVATAVVHTLSAA